MSLTQELVQIALEPGNWAKLSKAEKQSIIEWMDEQERKDKVDNFYSFCKHMDQKFFTESKWHLKLKCKYLQKLADEEIKKLIISEAPRAGKSYTVSLFHAWLIGKFPKDSSMRNSYAAELAEKFSYNIRDIVQKDEYLQIFPNVKLKHDKKAVTDWAITEARDSTYFCAGVGGPILGKGCSKVATLDDPIKNIEEAMSETILNKIWNWYTSTHLSRFEKGCGELHVATRWSKKDPIGRILEDLTPVQIEPYVQQYGDWVVITIPALINGETFCQDVHSTEEYLEIKKITDDFIWEAEFMQNPIESKGLLFPVEYLRRFSLKDLKGKPDCKIGFVDTADKGTDFLCNPIAYKYDTDVYITDVVFTQEGVEITEPLVAEMCIKHRLDVLKIESNNGGESFARNVRRILKEHKWHTTITTEHQSQNKETRILMKSGYIKENFIFRDDYEPGSDYDKYMRALTTYVKMGKNAHDDAPDGTTGLALMSEMNILVKKPPVIPPGKYYSDEELKDMYPEYAKMQIRKV